MWLRSHARWICVLLILVGCARVIATYAEFNHTADEPTHIACGLEWLNEHKYTYELQHPPLARIAVAIGPWLLGAPNVAREDLPSKNPLVLYQSRSYLSALASARTGVLPFFILGAVVVWFWTRRLHGDAAAILAVLLFTTLPPILAHAGLATTDMAVGATLPAAVYAFLRWLDEPTYKFSGLLGSTVALGLLSKYSFLVYFPVCVLVVLLLRFELPRDLIERGRKLLFAAMVAFVLLWASFWFRFTEIPGTNVWLPITDLYLGFLEALDHNDYGHLSYLFGELRMFGWWYFFPVVFAYKTPLAFIVLIVVGCRFLFRSQREFWIPLACAVAMMIAVLPSRINLGVRHILPLYAMLAIPAGYAAARLLQSPGQAPKIVAIGLLGWHVGASVLAHPNYIPYFNELAAGEPEYIRVDSDLDWGQDMVRLGKRLRELGIKEKVGLAWFGSTEPRQHGVDAYRLSPWEPSKGWIAVGVSAVYLSEEKPPEASYRRPFSWLRRYRPTERIGGMLLYYIPLQ